MADVDIINLALHSLGEQEVTSGGLTSPVTDLEKTAVDKYTPFIAARFAEHPWHFAKRHAALLRRSITITGATADNPVVLSSAETGRVEVGDIVYTATFTGGMTELNGNKYIVTAVVDDTSITIEVDGSGFSAYSAGGTAETRPLVKWTYQYELPSDLTRGPQAIYQLDSSTDYVNEGQRPLHGSGWDMENNSILTDCEAVAIEYFRLVPDDSRWDPAFKEFVYTAFAASIALDVTGSHSLQEKLMAVAWGKPNDRTDEGMFGKAKNVSGQTVPAHVVASNPLVEARFGGGGSRW